MSESTSAHRPGFLARLSAPGPLRWSLVELCRRTTHEGWDHLRAAEAAGRGVALTTPAGTPWVVAARALAAWAGPLHLALPAGKADRRLARLTCAGGPRLATSPKTVTEAISAGAKVLFVGSLEELTKEALLLSNPAILPLRVERRGRSHYRIVIGRSSALGSTIQLDSP